MLYYFKHFLHRYLLKFDQILEHIKIKSKVLLVNKKKLNKSHQQKCKELNFFN